MLVLCTGNGVNTQGFFSGLAELHRLEILPDPEDAINYLNDFPGEVNALLMSATTPAQEVKTLIASVRKKSKLPLMMLELRQPYMVKDRVAFFAEGLDDYVVNPHPREVDARLYAITRRLHGYTTSVLNVGDLFLDNATRKLWNGNKPDHKVVLSPGRHTMLTKLMLSPGQAIPKRGLVNNPATSDRIVNTEVRNIRMIFKQIETTVKIEAIPKQGFRVV